MTRTKSDAKRESILEAAIELFSSYGYRRTSIEDVARRAGIAKGTVYIYFRNKEQLFGAVCQQVAEHFLEATDLASQRPLPLESRVLAVLEAKFTYLYQLVHSSPHAAEIIQSKNAVANEIFSRADERYRDVLAEILAAADESKELTLQAIPITATQAAELLIRCAHGNGLGGTSGVRPSVEVYRHRLAEMTKIVLTGLGMRPSAPISDNAA